MKLLDEDLVRKAKHGDKDALLNLVIARKNDYYRLALIYTGNPEDAMDAVQDMTVIIYNQIHRIKKVEAFYPWSSTILVNCCRKIKRQRSRVISLAENHEIIAPNLHTEQYLDLVQALEKLKPPQREVIKLKYLVDMDYETIAQVLKIPVGTAKSRAFNGLRQLQAWLGGDYNE